MQNIIRLRTDAFFQIFEQPIRVTNVSLDFEAGNAGERLGLVGRNGHGKSTLFKLILGEEEADSGEIVIPRNYRIGHLEQHLHFTQPTILDEAALGLPEEETHSIYKAEAILFGLGFSGARTTIARGQVILDEGQLLHLDEEAIRARCVERASRLWNRIQER